MNPIKLLKVFSYLDGESFAPKKFANRLKAFCAYHAKSPVTSSRPIKLHVELTNACNLKCIMCPRGKMKRKVGNMETATFEKIVSELKGVTEFSYLHLMGESLFHPKWDEFVKIGKRAGVSMGLATNVTALDERNAQRIIDCGLDFLVMSVDGATAETYEQIRVNADFERTMANMERFLKMRPKGKAPHTVVQMIFMKGTEKQAAEYAEFWKKQGPDSIRIKPFQTWMGDQPGIKELGRGQNKKLQRPCDRIWRHSVVLWDGTVVPCEFDYDAKYPLGNIREQSFAEIFNNEKMQELRKVHAQGKRCDSELCRECDYAAPSLPMSLGLALLNAKASTKLISEMGL